MREELIRCDLCARVVEPREVAISVTVARIDVDVCMGCHEKPIRDLIYKVMPFHLGDEVILTLVVAEGKALELPAQVKGWRYSRHQGWAFLLGFGGDREDSWHSPGVITKTTADLSFVE